jgi:hypothetical protein
MALAVTGAGGLAMIGGMLILGNIVGSYNLTDILQAGDVIKASDWYLPALILILLGAFTKSAQFPFHFWLPHAMAAPTPVSAYLHSATMVKAGVFLMARMWPALAGTDAWFYIVATTGLVTMVLGALIALFKDDLKALLAFSTVSHLGLLDDALGLRHPGRRCRRRLSHHQPPDVQGRAVHDGGDRRSRDAYPRHQTSGRAQAPDADHLPHRHGRGAVDGGHSTVQRVPVQGNDAGGSLSHRLAGQSLRRAGLPPRSARCLSVAYSLRFVFHVFLGPVRDDYPSNPTIRPSACGPRRRFWRSGDRHRGRTVPCRRDRDRGGQRRDRRRPAPASEDLARRDTRALDVDHRRGGRGDPADAARVDGQAVERGCRGPRQRRSSTGWSPPSSATRARSPRSATTVRSVATSPSSRPPRWCLDMSPTPPAACRRRRGACFRWPRSSPWAGSC